MPLVDLANHIEPLEHMKVALGYALPKQHAAGLWGLQSLGCGDCGCAKCKGIGALSLTPENQAKLEAAINDMNVTSKQYNALEQKLVTQEAMKRAGVTGNQAVDTFNQIFDKVSGTLSQLMQARGNKPPKPRIVKEPDYVTPALIVGGTVMLGTLFYALAKKTK